MIYRDFKIYLFSVLMILISCTKEPADILTGGNYRYWKRKINNGLHQPAYYYCYFDIRGRYTVFHYYGKQFRKMKFYDDIPNEYWSIENDSLLNFGYGKYKICNISDEQIILNMNGALDTLIAVEEKDIPKKYRKLWDFSNPKHIVDSLYKTKIDSLYSENIKYLYNLLIRQKIISSKDSMNVYINDDSGKKNNSIIRNTMDGLSIVIKDFMNSPGNTYIITHPLEMYGQIVFRIILPKHIGSYNKNTIEIYYDYELGEYFRDDPALSWKNTK